MVTYWQWRQTEPTGRCSAYTMMQATYPTADGVCVRVLHSIAATHSTVAGASTTDPTAAGVCVCAARGCSHTSLKQAVAGASATDHTQLVPAMQVQEDNLG